MTRLLSHLSRRLAVGCVILAGFPFAGMHAATFQFADGDLLLGVRATSGTGSTKNVFLNLGPGVNHRDNGNLGQLADIGGTLASVYGADWYDRGDLYFGVFGNLSAASPSGIFGEPPVNGDPPRTFYISVATSAPSASVLIPAGTYVSSALGAAGTKFSGMEQMVATLDQQADGTAILDQGLKPTEWNNGWTAWNPVPGAAFDIFSGGILQSFGMGGSAAHVDIQRILATNTGANPTGTVGGGTYVTSISISNTGVVSAATPPPAQPELDVEQPAGTVLTTGSSSIDFGSVALGLSGSPVEFTIRSAGTGTLTVSSVAVAGDNRDDFILSGPAQTVLAAGETTTFAIRFNPTAAGSRAAVLKILSDDADESEFEIALTGSAFALAPEIEVEQPSGTALVDGTATRNLGTNVAVGSAGDLFTFVIRNTGNTDLSGIGVAKSGPHQDDFLVASPAVDSLAPAASTTFSVRFQPTAAGNRTANLQISSNDGDEKPFDITLTGSAFQPAAEIEIKAPGGVSLANGAGVQAFGKVLIGKTSASRTLTIRNIGNSPLTGLAVVKAGKNAGDFVVSALGATTLQPGGTAGFTVRFKPTAAGARAAVVRVTSNDADENPFDIPVAGTGIQPKPEIVVQQPAGSGLTDGKSKRTFGTVVLGKSVTRVFTIRNTGTARLTRLAVAKSGAHAKDFSIKQPAVGFLDPGKSTTFRVSFKPTATGIRKAAIRVSSNDADEHPFDVQLSGSGASRN